MSCVAGGRQSGKRERGKGGVMGNHDRPQTTKSVLINMWSTVSEEEGSKRDADKAVLLEESVTLRVTAVVQNRPLQHA